MNDSEEMKEKYKDRLKQIVGKKFDTVTIFPLSQFEAEFGSELWGMGKSLEDLTDKEYENRKKWERVRNNILNLGNRQKRNFFSELDSGYTIIWERFKTCFLPPKAYGDLNEEQKQLKIKGKRN